MVQKLQYYADLVKEVFADQSVKAQVSLFAEIDKMLVCDWDNPKELRDLPWIKKRKLVSTAPADACNAAARVFAAKAPNISVQPTTSDPDEYARVERIETALDNEFHRMNTLGKKPAHWQVVESAMRYCKVALQVEYLPYVFKARAHDNYIKAILDASKFNWRVHHPGTVFAQDGPFGQFEFVVKRSQYTANYLVAKYGEKNKGVQAMLEKLDKKGQDLSEQLATKIWYCDVYTWKDRVQWGAFDEQGTDFEFLRDEHNLPFIPWVVVDNGDPILRSVVEAELWKTANAIRTIVYSKAIDMVAHPALWIRTLTGDLKSVTKDETSPSGALVTDVNATVTPMPPPQIDQQLAQVQQLADSEIYRTSAAEVLASIPEDVARTGNFSVVNALLQAALTQLTLAQNCAERAEQLAFRQQLQWIDYTDIDLLMFRPVNKTVGDNTWPRGQQIVLTKRRDVADIPEDKRNSVTPVNPDFLDLQVKLQSANIIDKQAEITNEINIVERLSGSRELAFDRLGLGDYGLNEARRYLEDMTEAEKQAEIKRLLTQPDLEAAQFKAELASQQAQEQQAAQQEQQAAIENARLEQQNAAYAGAQGFDFRTAGGASPAGMTPGMGREQMTGEAFGGEGVA